MIVIVGLGTGGIYAARWISRFNRKEEITIIERRSYETYSPCSIPLVVEGAVEVNEIIHPFPHTRRINVFLEHEVVDIDTEKKVVKYQKLGDDEVKEIEYDKLIFSPGASPAVPPIPGVNKRGVFTVRTVEDAKAILDWIKRSKRVLVVGAGAIGMEMAYALRKRGLEVTVVEMLSHPFPGALDEDMARIVRERIEAMGIKCHCNSRVEEILGDEDVCGAVINGESAKFDMVILSVGVRPNTQLLKGKVNMDERGYIMVNERMETSVPDVYAVGDCVRTPYGILQLATVAAREGIVAGINAAGGNAIYTKHTGAFVSVMGKFEVSCVGKSGKISGKGHSTVATYSEDDVYVKLFVDEKGNILGAQAVGYQASKKIDIVSALMRKGGKVWDLAFMEHAYCPASSHLYDVLNIAATNAMRRIKIERYEV